MPVAAHPNEVGVFEEIVELFSRKVLKLIGPHAVPGALVLAVSVHHREVLRKSIARAGEKVPKVNAVDGSKVPKQLDIRQANLAVLDLAKKRVADSAVS